MSSALIGSSYFGVVALPLGLFDFCSIASYSARWLDGQLTGEVTIDAALLLSLWLGSELTV